MIRNTIYHTEIKNQTHYYYKKINGGVIMAGRKPKYETLQELRKAQNESSRKWYEAHKEERKAKMREYYRRTKKAKEGEQ